MRVPTLRGVFPAVAESKHLRGFAERRGRKFATLLCRAGRTGNPLGMSNRALSSSLAAAAISIPGGILLGALLWPPLLGLCLAPLVLYEYPEVALKDSASSRREAVEKELPFFAVLTNVLGSAGLSLYSIMETGLGKGAFPAMEGEALLLKRDVEIFGANPVDALERVAASHPSRKFADFLLGYTSKVRSGGDVPAYLAGESGSLLHELEVGWGRYAARVGVVGSLMVTMFGVVPLLLLVIGFFSPGSAIEGLEVFALVVVPVVTSALVVMSGKMQPMQDKPLHGRWILAGAAAIPMAIPGMIAGELWLMAALPLFAFCSVYGCSVRAQRKSAGEEESALPKFLRDLMEFKRLEYDLGKSLIAISAQFSYGREFDGLLSKVAAKLRSGISLDGANPDPHTTLGKMTFSVLGQMAYSGGGTVDTMYQLTHYTSQVIRMKEESRNEVRPYLLLSYVTPLLLVFGVAFVGGVLSNLGSSLKANVSSGAPPIPGFGARPELFQAANLLIVVSAAALGIVGAKMGDLTVRNTWRASTNLAIAVAATVLVPLLNISVLIR
jgi:flagellar protein FlaJ